MSDPFVAGLVLAAGGSRTLGRPKPLLPYNGGTLLDHALTTARACEFDQLLVTVGSKVEKVRASRIPFGSLLEGGLLRPGQKLYLSGNGIIATVLANGHIRCEELTGSIHGVASFSPLPAVALPPRPNTK